MIGACAAFVSYMIDEARSKGPSCRNQPDGWLMDEAAGASCTAMRAPMLQARDQKNFHSVVLDACHGNGLTGVPSTGRANVRTGEHNAGNGTRYAVVAALGWAAQARRRRC
jgi:hypothetical protein